MDPPIMYSHLPEAASLLAELEPLVFNVHKKQRFPAAGKDRPIWRKVEINCPAP